MGSELIPIPSNELPKEALLYGKFSLFFSQIFKCCQFNKAYNLAHV